MLEKFIQKIKIKEEKENNNKIFLQSTILAIHNKHSLKTQNDLKQKYKNIKKNMLNSLHLIFKQINGRC